jgi:hypothetical protein
MVALGPDGSLYVGDNGHFLSDPFSVRRFTPDGTDLGRFGAPGPGLAPGGFGWVAGIVVAPSGGMVVADEHNDCIQLVNPDGTFHAVWGTPPLRAVALATGPDDEVILLNSGDHRVYRARMGESPTVIAGQSEYRAARVAPDRRLAVAPNGDIAILDIGSSQIRRYGPDGAFKGEISAGPRPTPALDRFGGIATDDAGRYLLTRTTGAQVIRVDPLARSREAGGRQARLPDRRPSPSPRMAMCSSPTSSRPVSIGSGQMATTVG